LYSIAALLVAVQKEIAHMDNIYFDSRWEGVNGIGRVACEMRKRIFPSGNFKIPDWPDSPTSPVDPFVCGVRLAINRRSVFYSPGFNPPVICHERAAFTLHDLIHLRIPEEQSLLKRAYYQKIVRPAVHRCFKVLTSSEYSRSDVLEWSGADSSQLVNVGCGVDEAFFSKSAAWQPGYPYFLYVGARKPHKNLSRLLQAYAASSARHDVRLVLTGAAEASLVAQASALGVADKLTFVGRVSDAELPGLYQGAVALLFPSTFEGFGLPPLEAMAGGTPALTSNTTSLPEVVGDAAVQVDPYSVEALREGIDKIAFDQALRARLQLQGPVQARKHTWEQVAHKVGLVLNDLRNSVAP